MRFAASIIFFVLSASLGATAAPATPDPEITFPGPMKSTRWKTQRITDSNFADGPTKPKKQNMLNKVMDKVTGKAKQNSPVAVPGSGLSV
ncbi:hypothetical protein L208DRAFT_1399692 [Tricholoma matsutake]|nr:hypothetical protein L208DRAFT_1399692 [Tricholoma matsutake 945]